MINRVEQNQSCNFFEIKLVNENWVLYPLKKITNEF